MSMAIRCTSPIDGLVYAERSTLSYKAVDKAVAKALPVQAAWAARSLADRIALAKAGVATVGAMNEDVVPEISWQMVRTIRYGAEFVGLEKRATYIAEIAQEALADMVVENSTALRREIKRVPLVSCWWWPLGAALT